MRPVRTPLLVAATLGLAASLLPAAAARAQGTPPAAAPATSDRCEGTLCDLYYGSGRAAPAAAAPAPAAAGLPPGATPVTMPQGNIMNWFSRGSSSAAGGTSAAAAPSRPPPPDDSPASSTNNYMHLGSGGVLGDKGERCSGTMCDLLYGSSPPEGTKTAAAAPGATAAPAEPVVPYRHIVHESETRPKCNSPNADPWRCYR